MTAPSNLEQIQFFEKLEPNEIRFLANYIEEKKFQKGEVILPQGIQGKELYLIISGQVFVDIVLPGDDFKKNLAKLGKGQVFGEVTFLTKTQATASVTAKEACKCLTLSHKTLEMLRLVKPEIAYKIEQEITYQAAAKVIYNINAILELLKKIPEDSFYPFDHSIYVEDPKAHTKLIELSELNLNDDEFSSFFPKLAEKQKSGLLSMMTVKAYDKGYRFSAKEAESRKIAFIYSGAVMFFIKKNKTLKKSIAVLAVGDLFLQNFLSPNFQEVADFVTCEKSILLELDLNTYTELKETDPHLFYLISEKINRNIANAVYIVNRQFLRINCEYNNLIL
ncbi:MAG: cyclic nucleotide-binding domain-containing protein [Tatlockia sp.]|nr:cyclic nucleotide-binding domain-containing protein [Tatlockia sp.]